MSVYVVMIESALLVHKLYYDLRSYRQFAHGIDDPRNLVGSSLAFEGVDSPTTFYFKFICLC